MVAVHDGVNSDTVTVPVLPFTLVTHVLANVVQVRLNPVPAEYVVSVALIVLFWIDILVPAVNFS